MTKSKTRLRSGKSGMSAIGSLVRKQYARSTTTPRLAILDVAISGAFVTAERLKSLDCVWRSKRWDPMLEVQPLGKFDIILCSNYLNTCNKKETAHLIDKLVDMTDKERGCLVIALRTANELKRQSMASGWEENYTQKSGIRGVEYFTRYDTYQRHVSWSEVDLLMSKKKYYAIRFIHKNSPHKKPREWKHCVYVHESQLGIIDMGQLKGWESLWEADIITDPHGKKSRRIPKK